MGTSPHWRHASRSAGMTRTRELPTNFRSCTKTRVEKISAPSNKFISAMCFIFNENNIVFFVQNVSSDSLSVKQVPTHKTNYIHSSQIAHIQKVAFCGTALKI